MKSVFVTLLMPLVVLGLASSCGSSNEKKSVQTVEQKPIDQVDSFDDSSLEAAPSDLPEMVVVRVPLDGDGNEQADNAIVRTASGVQGSIDADIAAAFSVGSEIEVNATKAVDELDADSSTQSWYWGSRARNYVQTPWYPGKLLGRGLWWGRNPWVYRGGYSSYYYNHRYYQAGGYRYYSYCRTGYGGW